MFENTRIAFKKIHLLLLSLSQSVMVFLPLFRLLSLPPLGVVIRCLILSGASLILMIFNLIVESGEDKPTKKERKFAKSFRKHARTVSNFACFILLMFAWYTNDDPQLRIPLIFTSISVIFSLISYICRYVITTLVTAIQSDLDKPLEKVKHSIGETGRKIGESITQMSERAKERRAQRIEAREAEAALSAPEGEEPTEALPSPKKRGRLRELFRPKRESHPEALPAPQEEAEEVLEEALSEV